MKMETNRKKPRRVKTVFAVLWMILAMGCIVLIASGIYYLAVTLSVLYNWRFVYPFLHQGVFSDFVIVLACMGGLLVYYRLCRCTKAARTAGIVIGLIFSVYGIVLIPVRSIAYILFPLMFLLIIVAKTEALGKEYREQNAKAMRMHP